MLNGFPKALSFGGHLGNSLFYFISGYGLALSFIRSEIPFLSWILKRLIKLAIPILFFSTFLSLGEFKKFIHLAEKYLIWNEFSDFQSFIPVLLILYFLFIPLFSLSCKALKTMIAAICLFTFTLLIQRIIILPIIPKGLPSNDVFFFINGLVCFSFGILAVKDAWLTERTNKRLLSFIAFLFLCLSQLLHQIIFKVDHRLVFINFYLNFISVLSIYIIFSQLLQKKKDSFLHNIAGCSLGVYLIHLPLIGVFNRSVIGFPANFILLLTASFLLAYPLTYFSNYLSSKLIGFFSGSRSIKTDERTQQEYATK
jgi:hypothetical protein